VNPCGSTPSSAAASVASATDAATSRVHFTLPEQPFHAAWAYAAPQERCKDEEARGACHLMSYGSTLADAAPTATGTHKLQWLSEASVAITCFSGFSSSHWQSNAYVIQKRRPCTGNLNRETSGDSIVSILWRCFCYHKLQWLSQSSVDNTINAPVNWAVCICHCRAMAESMAYKTLTRFLCLSCR